MKNLTFIFVAASMLLSCASSNGSMDSGNLNVLLISGGAFHNYEEQQEALAEGLEERLDIDLTIVESASSTSHILPLHTQSGWEEGYDVVIYNICHASTTDTDYIDGIAEAHYDSGVGAIFMHCAMHTYRDAETESWDHMVGIDTYHHENQQRGFELLPLNPDHPVMADFPEEGWTSPRDEIYIVEEMFDNLIPLAHAYGPETDTFHVVMWANTYGDARIVGTTAGHNTAVIEDPVYLDFIANGIEWAAGSRQ